MKIKTQWTKKEREQAKEDMFNIGKTNGKIATAQAVGMSIDLREYDQHEEEA